MQISLDQNRADLTLENEESFFVTPSFLRGYPNYEWTLPPPHFLGSILVRLYHHRWILKEVSSGSRMPIPILGTAERGSFHLLDLAEGEKYSVSTRHLAGFSSSIRSIRTRIRLLPAFWLLHERFFSIFEGPGKVLLYSGSPLQLTAGTEVDPSRLVAFDARKKFRPISPSPRTLASQLINLIFSHEVIWQFAEPGKIITKACGAHESVTRQGGFRRFVKHLLGFLRI